MAKLFLTKAKQLDIDLVAIIALPGNSVEVAIEVYDSFDDLQKESALQHNADIFIKALELQNTVRNNMFVMNGNKSNFKVNLTYLGIDYDEIIKDDELFILLENMIYKKEDELKDWFNY